MSHHSQLTPWHQRRSELSSLLELPAVRAALDDLADVRGVHHERRTTDDFNDDPTDRQLDLALALIWSACRTDPRRDSNILRLNALPKLDTLPGLCWSEKDFSSTRVLQKGYPAVVEVVRCKHDRQLYVLKTILKGPARREPGRGSPLYERLLIRRASLANDADLYTPRLQASFQSPGSLHIVMEYFPAGDLCHMLESAAEADSSYPGRNPLGGLLLEQWTRKYAVDMVAAVSWIHRQGYAHR